MNQTLTIRIPDDLREGLQELSRNENDWLVLACVCLKTVIQ